MHGKFFSRIVNKIRKAILRRKMPQSSFLFCLKKGMIIRKLSEMICQRESESMNKQEIISILNKFPYSRDEYWIITGSAMVLYGIRDETHDIDMGCTSRMADQLEADGYSSTLTESGNRRFKIGENIEVYENWIRDTISMVDDVPVISINGLVMMKQQLGRDKDIKDITLIKEYMRNQIEICGDKRE